MFRRNTAQKSELKKKAKDQGYIKRQQHLFNVQGKINSWLQHGCGKNHPQQMAAWGGVSSSSIIIIIIIGIIVFIVQNKLQLFFNFLTFGFSPFLRIIQHIDKNQLFFFPSLPSKENCTKPPSPPPSNSAQSPLTSSP